MDRCYIKILASIFVLAVFLMPAVVNASDFENAAFRKDVSKELKNNFSPCEEFLAVKWIDKARNIGLLKADVIKNGKSEPRYLLVYLEKPGSKAFARRGNGIFYEIGEKEYSSKQFGNFLHGARYKFNHENVFVTIKKGKRTERFPQEPLPFEAFVGHEKEFPSRSFSAFSSTVCVAYPGGKQALVIEAKKPFIKSPMDEKTKQAYDNVAGFAKDRCNAVAKSADECKLDYLKDSYALDINGDGKDDYIFLISDKQGGKGQVKRYLMLSGAEGYGATDVSGCLGFGRFFYGTVSNKQFHLGRCK